MEQIEREIEIRGAIGSVLAVTDAMHTLEVLTAQHRHATETDRGEVLGVDSLLGPLADRLRAAGDVLTNHEDKIVEALNRGSCKREMTPEDAALILQAKAANPEAFKNFLAIMQAGGEHVTRLKEVIGQLDQGDEQ